MSEPSTKAAVRDALHELHSYLSDQMAPMMVTDSIELLLRCPPQVVAQSIEGWVSSQYRGAAASAPVSDCLFHAMKKIHLMSEFELIGQELIEKYLSELANLVIGQCPEQDRPMLARNISQLGKADGAAAAQVEILYRQQGTDAPARAENAAAPAAAPTAATVGRAPAAGVPAPVATAAGPAVTASPQVATTQEEIVRGMNRFAFLLDRLGTMGGAVAQAGAGEAQDQLQSQLLSTAAVNSRSDEELDQYLQRLNSLGVNAKTNEVFRALSNNLPGWAIPDPVAAGLSPEDIPTPRPVEAMRRLISMADSSEESGKRFDEMVQAAIEQFNAGNLVQATTMFELAERISAENRINPEVVRTIRIRAHEKLSEDQLRSFADKPEHHPHLRKLLGFFPSMSTKGLLSTLQDEPRRDRRKLMLALLVAHGSDARVAALELLGAFVEGGSLDPEGFFQRNLIYLLRHIPRNDEPGLGQELSCLAQLSHSGNPLMVVKEAVGVLALLDHAKAEQVLIACLREFEEALIKNELPYSGNELRGLLDRITAALARFGTKNAARAVVGHAFKSEPALGRAMARIEALGGTNLADDPELVDQLIKTLKGELPSKVLGFMVKKKNENIPRLIHALSGTPSEPVKTILGEIVERFPERGFADVASKCMAKLGAPTSSAAESRARVLSGDVELFGLPNLLQTLGDSQVTGVLTLADREDTAFATMLMKEGKICGCRIGELEGEDAVYQLFEKPLPGNFTFKGRELADDQVGEIFEILPAILEAMRRHDEFQQARALVPDDMACKPGQKRPTPPENGEDPVLMRSIWLRASKGAAPGICEGAFKADSYRIRRLFAHWVEEGALLPA